MTNIDTASPHPGTLSPRDIDTRRYRVVSPLPNDKMPGVGETFAAWPWGEVLAHVVGIGPVCRNAEIAGWVKAGLLEEIRGKA